MNRMADVRRTIPLDALVPNPWQPREAFDHVDELATSLLVHGQDVPIIVRERPGGVYEVADGESRVRAARLNHERDPQGAPDFVDAVVRDLDDAQMALTALRTAYTRAALTPIEEGRGLQRLLDDFGMTKQELADRLGKTKAYVVERVRLLALPDDVRAHLDNENLNPGQAVALGSVDNPLLRTELLKETLSSKLAVKTIRDRRDAVLNADKVQNLDGGQRAKLTKMALKGLVGPQGVQRVAAEMRAQVLNKDLAPAPWDRLKSAWPQLSVEEQEDVATMVADMASRRQRP